MGQFSLLTINIFGLPLIAGRRRLRTLAKMLNQEDATILCTQEIQQFAYLKIYLEECTRFPYHASESHLYAPKGGLLTLSRVAMSRSAFTSYHSQGGWLNTDRPLNKGILLSELAIGGRRVIVLNTHVQLNARGDFRRESPRTRVQFEQVQQLAALAATQPADALVIVCGDLNFPRGSFLYEELLAIGGLVDPLAGDTRPTYRPPPQLQSWALPLDFALLRPTDWPGLRWSTELQFDQKVPIVGGGEAYVSDHNGLEILIQWDD